MTKILIAEDDRELRGLFDGVLPGALLHPAAAIDIALPGSCQRTKAEYGFRKQIPFLNES
ncbi:MAG: hypothetical protein IJ466_05035 [Clostridia bacterium]|nr:hypothetical protein [Clostridia bacterium]